jgi:heat shock protein HslJ
LSTGQVGHSRAKEPSIEELFEILARELFSVMDVSYMENILMELTMKKTRFYLLVLTIVAGIILAACSGGASASGSLIGTWELVSYGDPANPTPAAADVETSVIFGEDGTITGNVGCNGFGGDYQVDGDTITFGPISSTLMMCADTAIGDQETVVLNTLIETVNFVIDGGTLTITSPDGSSVIVLARK